MKKATLFIQEYRMIKIHISSLFNKLHIDSMLLFLITLLLCYSAFVVWSACGQNIEIMEKKILHIAIGLLVMLFLAQIKPIFYEKLAPYLYVFCVLLLILVDVFGQFNKGAQRWLDIGFIKFQPSEIAKISVPLMVARFMKRCPPSINKTAVTLIIISVPSLLVAAQPDLGTAILIATAGLFVLFISGISWKFIAFTALLVTVCIPVLWLFMMHDYQRERIMMLLDPANDPLGAGYHIIQSKIAIGSGGLNGKGWLHGTQSQLEFLPERNTDFIFSVLSEELGLIGVLALLALYISIIMRCLMIALRANNTFGRIITSCFIFIFFIYIFINIGMVTGILPVVGVPLPLVSYGGSAMIMLMAEFGIIMSIYTHSKKKYYKFIDKYNKLNC